MCLHEHTQAVDPVRVVLVGGIDPGCGAGLARDLLTAHALGARTTMVGTAWTEQRGIFQAREDRRALPDGPHRGRSKEPSQGSFSIEPRDPERLRASLSSAFESGESLAVKVGMVATAAIARAVEGGLGAFAGPVVYDPVLRASSGGALYDGDRESVWRLARRSTLLTPNLAEAAWLLERPVRTPAEARAAARTLQDLGIPAVLVKGGHLEDEAADVLVSAAGESVFASARVAGPSPRGTGCALATAIAVRLASGDTLERAVAAAKSWLTERIERATTVGGERVL